MKSLLRSFRRAAVALLALLAVSTAHAANDPIQSHSTEVNGVTLHYLQAGHGTGAPVVLLHGYAETSHMWRPLIEATGREPRRDRAGPARCRRLLVKPQGGYDKKNMAQDIHALVQSLGYPKVEIVGHDIGLMVAYAYAAQYPDQVESVVLMDAFLPGVGDWTKVWLLRDLWHFHFYGEVPLKLVDGRERTYFEHFWNDFAADRTHSVSEGRPAVLRRPVRASRAACVPASSTSATSSKTPRTSPASPVPR